MAMVESQLTARGIVDTCVLEAMAWVPREDFLPEERQSWAYRDRAVPLAHGQTVSQPYMVAAMTESLRLGPEDRVLEVGTGSGYHTAVLRAITAEVFTIERLPDLQAAAEERLAALAISNVRFRVGDGSLGWSAEAPFDAIIVTAGAPSVPPALKSQLNEEGGRLVIPVGPRHQQSLIRYTRTGNEYVTKRLLNCAFVPLVGSEGWPSGYAVDS